MFKWFVDPGHGGADPGAVGNGLQEKNVTLKIAKKIKEIAENEYDGVEVRLSRYSDETVSLNERTNQANDWGADLLTSVHINAGGGTGFESYIFNGNVSSTTKRAQDVIHDNIMSVLIRYDVRDRGKKRANFHMLRESVMPAVLFENLFIDNPKDLKLLRDDKFIDDLPKAIAVGIAKAFSLPRKSGSSSNSGGGSLLKKGMKGDEVKDLQQVLMELGYGLPEFGADGIFGQETERAVREFQADHSLKVDGIVGPKTRTKIQEVVDARNEGVEGYRVQVGYFKSLENARKKQQEAEKYGLEAAIIPVRR